MSHTPYHAEIRPYQGRATIFINDQPQSPLMYCLCAASGSEPWTEPPQRYFTQFAEAGYRILGIDTWLHHVWRPGEPIDVGYVQRQVRAVLDVCPDAFVLIRINVSAPAWWIDENPDERVRCSLRPGDEVPEELRENPDRFKAASFASHKWRQQAGAVLEELLHRLADTDEGQAVAFIHVAGGAWGEWFYDGFDFEPDTGPCMTQHFRNWLRAKYASDDALQAAWQTPDTTLDTVEVPDAVTRFRSTSRMFRDPQRERRTMDYYMCQQELVADTPLYFCKIVRDTWPRPIIVGIFHAYFLHIHHQASGGHLEMHRVLSSPYFDYLASPFSYEYDARFPGGSGHFRCLTETVRHYGKLWMSEVDHPTHFGDHFKRPAPFSPTTLADSIATMRRNTAHTYTLGQGMWWYDFGPVGNGVGGWWDHPDMLAEAADELALYDKLLHKPYIPAADVLLVYDTHCFYHLGHGYLGLYHQSKHWYRTETLSFEAANRTVAGAYRSGAAFDTIHLNDLAHVDLDRYKVIVFAFTPFLSADHVATIKNRVQTPGRTVVWVYAPGYTDGETLDTSRIGAVTGIEISQSDIQLPPELVIRQSDLAPGFPETRVPVEIQDAWTAPTFRVTDANATPLGYYGGSRDVALARKNVNGVDTWYCALPLKHPGIMREIFRHGGAHIYNNANDVLFAGGGVLCIHTETGGERTIRLSPDRERVFQLEPFATVLLDTETGGLLLGP